MEPSTPMLHSEPWPLPRSSIIEKRMRPPWGENPMTPSDDPRFASVSGVTDPVATSRTRRSFPSVVNAMPSPVGDHVRSQARSAKTSRGSEPSDRATVSDRRSLYATCDPSGEWVVPYSGNGSSRGVLPSRGTSTLSTLTEVPSGIHSGS